MLLLLECVNVLLKAVEDEQRKAIYHESRVSLMCLLEHWLATVKSRSQLSKSGIEIDGRTSFAKLLKN